MHTANWESLCDSGQVADLCETVFPSHQVTSIYKQQLKFPSLSLCWAPVWILQEKRIVLLIGMRPWAGSHG